MADAPAVEARPTLDKRWTFPGGDEDDDAVTLYIRVRADDGAVFGYDVRIPINADAAGVLKIGEVEVKHV